MAVLGAERTLDAEVGQRVDALARAQSDAAAVAAVAAIRPAEGHELLAPETHAAASAVTGLDFDACFIDEFHGLSGAARHSNEKPGDEPGFSYVKVIAVLS